MGYKILLIDDEADILEFVKYNLERDGYEVHTASNGKEGLEVALTVKPHLILLLCEQIKMETISLLFDIICSLVLIVLLSSFIVLSLSCNVCFNMLSSFSV